MTLSPPLSLFLTHTLFLSRVKHTNNKIYLNSIQYYKSRYNGNASVYTAEQRVFNVFLHGYGNVVSFEV